MTQDIHWHDSKLTRKDRWEALGASGATIWLTGLSGSGKSTVAAALEQHLVALGRNAYRLDGDNIRHGLNAGLSFSPEDRQENIRRIAEVTKLFADAGVITIASFISPYRGDRDNVRKLHEAAHLPFFEVWVDCPVEVCEQRDPKGLYGKARAGEITGFTGIDAPYEAPQAAELVLKSSEQSIEACVEACLNILRGAGVLTA